MVCENCREEFDEVDGRRDGHDDFYCASCYGDLFNTCHNCDCEVFMEDAFYVSGDYYCDGCFSRLFFMCTCCNEEIPNDEARDSVDGDICGDCYTTHYRSCSCGDTVYRDSWCDECNCCGGCCECTECCNEAQSEPCYPTPPAPQHEPLTAYGSTSPYGALPTSIPYGQPHPVPQESPALRGGSMPAIIQSLDNEAFKLCDENITTVLGILDKSKKLKVLDVTGRRCTSNDSYYKLSEIVTAVGKVKKPRYVYGVRSNECDVVIHGAERERAITNKLSTLGLTYKFVRSDEDKVGLSFRIRKRKYSTCVKFLEFLCNI